MGKGKLKESCHKIAGELRNGDQDRYNLTTAELSRCWWWTIASFMGRASGSPHRDDFHRLEAINLNFQEAPSGPPQPRTYPTKPCLRIWTTPT